MAAATTTVALTPTTEIHSSSFLSCSSSVNSSVASPCMNLVLNGSKLGIAPVITGWTVQQQQQFTANPNSNDSSGNYSMVEAAAAAFPFYMRIYVTVFCVLILVVGVFGNLLVPLVVRRNRDMRNSTNFFLVNLSIADLLVVVVCLPTVLVEIHSRPEVWIMGEVICKVVPFLELAVAHGSALTILAISFERYYAICKPLKASYKLTRMRAMVIIVALWFFATLVTCPTIAITTYQMVLYIDDTYVPSCSIGLQTMGDMVYQLIITVVFFVLPLVILMAIYTVIVRHLMATPMIMGTKLDTANMRARRQVVVMVGTVVVFFFVCLLPYRVLVVWIVLGGNVGALQAECYYNVLFFCRIMCYINSAINPILYNVTSTKFRQAFMRALGLRKSDRRHRLDRQTTFNTTYTSLYSSLKVRAIERTVNGLVLRQNSAQDSAV